jgi:hypothetical protein
MSLQVPRPIDPSLHPLATGNCRIAAPMSSTTTVNEKSPPDFRREGRYHVRTLSLTARRPSASLTDAL